MLVLDKGNKSLAVYRRTQYGDVLLQALSNQNNRLYDKSLEDWQEILKRNNNFDVAYIGIGQALFDTVSMRKQASTSRPHMTCRSIPRLTPRPVKMWSNKYFWTIRCNSCSLCARRKGIRYIRKDQQESAA